MATDSATTRDTPKDTPKPQASKKGKNLVVCIDGTANKFGMKNTNVVELYTRLVKDETQVTYYNSGIGTYARPSWVSLHYLKQTFVHTVDMMIAWNFERIVLSAYQWLSENYEDGDRIFLFGFSRGAYQVRVIAGMIERVGLLHKGNNDQIPFAYELYAAAIADKKRDPQDNASSTKRSKKHLRNTGKRSEDPEEICKHFKRSLSRKEVKVHFVGVWDTVSSIGVARSPTLPETTSGMTHVGTFRHALALNERRVKFSPEYVNGGMGPVTTGEEKGSSGKGDVKEVWFAGSHSDIGGGNIDNLESKAFGPSLRWMTYEAIQCDLKMEPFLGEWEDIQFQESLKGPWKILEYIPFTRLSYKNENNTTHWPHRGHCRQLKPGQLIHESALSTLKDDKKIPTPPLPNGTSLTRENVEKAGILEKDPYLSVEKVMDAITNNKFDEWVLNVLSTLTSTDTGHHAIREFPGSYGILFSALMKECQKENHDLRIINVLIKSLAEFRPSGSIRHLVDMNLDGSSSISEEHSKSLKNFFGIKVFQQHESRISAVTFSPDGTKIALGLRNGVVEVLEAETGLALMEPLSGHSRTVWAVNFAPAGDYIVSGSWDGTVRVWNLKTRLPQVLEGHTDWVWSVVYSPDGKLIASGSNDRTIKVWNSETGEILKTLRGHTSYVFSVAFSPDGRNITSGSMDATIRIWDVESGEMIGEPLRGHTGDVNCVAVSPDGTRIVSGSDDFTIRFWNSETREMIGEPLQQESRVLTVRFSPDGRHIVSGLGNSRENIYIWDVATRAKVTELLGGHNGGVESISFSPDGTKVIACSRDILQIWEIDLNTIVTASIQE